MTFRSPGSRPSPRIQRHHIPEGPIQDFTTIIENTSAEDWQKRTSALQALVSTIPPSYENDNDNSNDNHHHPHDDWYNSPPTLRHLAIPLSELIKDARSTVVKRTCESLNELFSKCKTDAKYLLKDLMPSVCQVHASTVQVIRNIVQAMILETFSKFPCKKSV